MATTHIKRPVEYTCSVCKCHVVVIHEAKGAKIVRDCGHDGAGVLASLSAVATGEGGLV